MGCEDRGARVAVMSLPVPPGAISHKAACRRHAAWERSRDSWRCRRDQTRSTSAWSSAVTRWHAGERSAATATDRASFGSFLFEVPVDSSRTRAPSLGWTSMTCSPAATSCWASRCPRPPAPSTAQVRSGQSAAHSTSLPAWLAEARMRTVPSGASAASIATAV
jgi:hypothetical protein